MISARDRGVSTVLGYVLALGITALLVSGLMLAGGQFVDDQRDRVVRSELSVVAERFATDLSAADRLAATDGGQAVRVDSRLPRSVGGSAYAITVTNEVIAADRPNHYTIEVSTRDGRNPVSVTTTIGVHEEVVTGTHPGGDLSIVLTGSGLEVRSD